MSCFASAIKHIHVYVQLGTTLNHQIVHHLGWTTTEMHRV